MQIVQREPVEVITITTADLVASDVKRFAGIISKVSNAATYDNVDVAIETRASDNARVFKFRQRPPLITSLR